MRLAEDLAEEELEEAAVVARPVVPVELRPALVGVQLLVECMDVALGGGQRVGEGGADVGYAVDPVGMVGGQERGPMGAARESHQQRALGVRGVHDRESVVGELAGQVGIRPARPVGAAVAPAVERQHPEMAREVGNLPLPVARMDDRPGGQQQDRVLALAVDLVEDPHASALDIPLAVGVAGAGLLGAGGRFHGGRHRSFASSRDSSQRSIASSSSRWPVSTPDSRSASRPMLKV